MHIPVLLNEVLEYLNPQPNENFIDCTINGGGHSLEIVKRIKPDGKILGIDWDREVLNELENKLGQEEKKNFILACDNYANLKSIVEEKNFYPVNGILFDLGMSSWNLEESGRGFSFFKDEPLDMRYSAEQTLTAKEIINKWPEQELVRIFKEFGEEKRARAIARSIVWHRQKSPVEKTTELVEIIKKAVPARNKYFKMHPATRVFQVLRIAVNDELENLKSGLAQAVEILALRGRIAVISFHSLEDRIVKNFFKEKARTGEIKILTKKPVVPSEEEINQNPRARSAKLRAALKPIN